MKINTKCRYGTRAVLEIARHSGDQPIKRSEIVSSQEITDSYLENILVSLKKSGIIHSIRGPRGGYVLNKKAEEITLLEIFNSMGENLTTVDCISDAHSCPRIESCETRPAWARLRQVQEEFLKGVTIDDLLTGKKELL